VPFKLIYSNGAPMHPPFILCDHVQQVAPHYLQEALDAGEPPDRHSLVPYGFTVPTGDADFQPEYRQRMRRELGLPLDRKIIISVGWISVRLKRMDYLIRELASLPEPRPYFAMIGAMDENSPPILHLARQMLGDNNFTARSVPYQQAFPYYQAADAFALASLVEGFGRAYVEACMHGLPCAANDHPVMRFVLGDEGTFGDFSKPGSLAEILAQMVQSPLDISAMQRRRQSMRDRFSWESLAPAYFQMFKKAAQS
jgi:1,2-diacylglycerol 3-alpha-glucosyltransferase